MLFYTVFLVAMFTAIILVPPLTYIYNKFNLFDMPSARKVHTVPIPRVGGVAIVIASIIPVIGWIEIQMPQLGLLLAIIILFCLGVIDDIKNLSYKYKFIVQMVSIAVIFLFGFVDVDNSYYAVNEIVYSLPLLAIYFFFILGVTNAINLADGLDGLAGGEVLLSFSIIGLLAFETDNYTIVLIILSIIGAIFGFLRFNTYPAKIFMGDAGSLFLGFVLGVLSIACTYGTDNAYSKVLPLLLVGFPIFDTLMVIFIRVINGRSPFSADKNHFHHKLLDSGYKHYQSVLMIYLIQGAYILAAYYLRFDSEFIIIITFLLISLVAYLISLVNINTDYVKSRRSMLVETMSKVGKQYIEGKTNQLFFLIAAFMLVYIFTAIGEIQDFKNDILLLLSLIALIGIYGLLFSIEKPCTWLERIAIHVMIVMAIYFGAQNETSLNFNNLHIGLLISVVVLISALMLGDRSKRFIGSPLDFLLIATAIIIPNLPNSPMSNIGISSILIELLVLFYCIEYILFNIRKNWWAMRVSLTLSSIIPVFVRFL